MKTWNQKLACSSSSESRMLSPVLYILGVALIFFLVVGVFTGRNIQQTEESVERLMAERGNAIIEIFESSLRSDLRTRSGVRVQELLEDLASREDILFVALVLGNGEIVAHSDPSRVGQMLTVDGKAVTQALMKILADTPFDPSPLSEDGTAGSAENQDWRIVRMEGHWAFVVHRALFRIRPGDMHVRPSPQPDPMYNPMPGFRISPPPMPQPVQVFVGQDARPLKSMKQQSMHSGLLTGTLVLVIGLVAFFALHYFERGLESRRRMVVAETLAQSMVDEVKRLEKEMVQREKQAAVGDLAAGVAHELRNPLSSIKGYATYFGSLFPDGSDDRESALIMVQEVDRLNRVITDLIGVSRPTDINTRPTDMASLSDSILLLLGQDAGQRGVKLRRITIHPNIHDDTLPNAVPSTTPSGPVMACIDPDRFRQALLNVCLNAVEAMQDGGELTLCLSANETHVMLDVEDNGPGIPPELLSRIFDPYFTTKSQGTGLGLVMVMKIVEAHGGTIHVTSEPGHGATVHFVLPRTEAACTTCQPNF